MFGMKNWKNTWGKIDWDIDSEEYLCKRIKALLKKGANVETKGKFGRTVLMLLAERGDEGAFNLVQ